MAIGILGRKLGMTQVFTEDGRSIPVTVIEAGPCLVLQKKTVEKDGYNAVQLGLVGSTPKRLRTKPVAGHLQKGNAGNISFIKEIRGNEMHDLDVGDTVPLDLLAENDVVNVTGQAIGKGFQGTVKRHGFRGLPATHGTHKKQRSPGAIGMCAWPSRTFKGMGMPGRMGGGQKTVKNLQIIRIDKENNVIFVRGCVPGSRKGKIMIKRLGRVNP